MHLFGRDWQKKIKSSKIFRLIGKTMLMKTKRMSQKPPREISKTGILQNSKISEAKGVMAKMMTTMERVKSKTRRTRKTTITMINAVTSMKDITTMRVIMNMRVITTTSITSKERNANLILNTMNIVKRKPKNMSQKWRFAKFMVPRETRKFRTWNVLRRNVSKRSSWIKILLFKTEEFKIMLILINSSDE